MNGTPLVLLANTTVLYSALAYKGLENRVLLSGDFVFITTEFTVAKIYRIVVSKRGAKSVRCWELIRG